MDILSDANTTKSTATLSSYALMTAERLFSVLGITLSREQIMCAMKNNQSVYGTLLTVPLKNVLNGIVLQQATDYQIYLQKLFIDYLMSGMTTLTEDSPGAQTRKDIETHREYVQNLGIKLQALELEHLNLISETQKTLIELTQNLFQHFDRLSSKIASLIDKQGHSVADKNIRQVINLSVLELDMMADDMSTLWPRLILASLDLELSGAALSAYIDELNFADLFKYMHQSMEGYYQKSVQEKANLQSIRQEFFDAIALMQKLLNLLPGNLLAETHSPANLDLIQFDKNLA